MPENQSDNRAEDAIIPNGEASNAAPTENAWEQFERGRFSRRQALKKFGITSAMAAFALFSVDDLAQMVGKAMEQRARDNKVAQQVAKEFQQAGVAFADGGFSSGSGCSGTGRPCYNPPPPSAPGPSANCQHCSNQSSLDIGYCDYVYDVAGSRPNPTLYTHCMNQATYNFDGCVCCWCSGGYAPPPNNTLPSPGQLQPPQGCNC